MNIDRFINYLDTYKTKSNINFEELSLLISNINNEYINQDLHSTFFSGSIAKQPLHYIINLENSPNTHVSIITNKHNHSTTHYNKSTKKIILNQKPYKQHLYTTQLNDIKKYNLVFNQCPISSTSNTNLFSPTIKESYTIDQKIDTIQDILNILEKYASPKIDDTKEYNIDLENLIKIKPELQELNAMIGMHDLKKCILSQLIYFLQNMHLHPEGNSKESDYKHTVVYGPPGTGKTEIAKIIGRMYSKIGVLKNGTFKKVTRNDLVAGYLGQTAIKTKNVINDCLGGVLFIDEAYSLSNLNDLDNFSKECIDTLCESLSDHKNDLMVIIAGYESELDKHFFKANAGLESRFVWRFKISEYNSNELKEIFLKKVKCAGWIIEENTNTLLCKWFDKHKADFKGYGRDIESLFFYSKICHSKRVYGKSPQQKRHMNMEDIEQGMKLFIENKRNSLDEKETQKVRQIIQTMYL